MKREKRCYKEPSIQVISFQDMEAVFTDMTGSLAGSPGREDFDDIFNTDSLPM